MNGQYSNEQRKKLAAARKKNIIGILVVAAIAVAAYFIFTTIFQSGDIRTVKNTPHQPTNMTFGEILDGYCNRTSWKSFTSAQYMKVVEFTGRTPDGDDILIQFSDRYGLADGFWEIVYMEINGRQAGAMETANWMMNAAHHARN
jgi:hypothetical protein